MRRFVAGLDGTLLLCGLDAALARAVTTSAATQAPIDNEIRNIVRKTSRLADAFLENEIDRDAYMALKARYDAALARLRGLLESTLSAPYDDRRAESSAFLQALAAGRVEDEAFYLSLIERIDVNEYGALELTLRGMTERLRAAYK